MPNLKCLVFVFCLLANFNISHSQAGFSHEIGIIAGPLQFRSDYGIRDDSKTNFGNTGIGIGIVHYMNFSYRPDCNCYSTEKYFSDHFKLRNEISWNTTKLEHFGEFVDPSKTSVNADKLRGHTGEANNLDIGAQLEFYPLSIRSFQSFSHRVSPFASLGLHYTAFRPKVETTFNNIDNPSAIGDIEDASNFYTDWDPGSVDISPGSAWSIVSSIGTRYKLSKFSDLMLDLRGQYYFNDWIDGLNHQLDSNKNNDWLVWLNVGYIYYLN